MIPARLLERIRRGHVTNVRYSDFARLVAAVGFRMVRKRGSHRIYRHASVPGLLTLQESSGEAKPYQIRQFLRTMDEHGLTVRDSS